MLKPARIPSADAAVVKAAKAALEGKTVDGKLLSDRVRERLRNWARIAAFIEHASPGNHRECASQRRRGVRDRASGGEADLSAWRTCGHGGERDGKSVARVQQIFRAGRLSITVSAIGGKIYCQRN